MFALNTIAQETKDINLSKSITIDKHPRKGVYIKDPEGNTFKVPPTIHAVTKLSSGHYVTYDEVDFSYHTHKFYKLKLRNNKFEEKNPVSNLSDYYFNNYGPGEFFSEETNKSYLVLERKIGNNYLFNVMDNNGKLVFKNDLQKYRGVIAKWVNNLNDQDKRISYSIETGEELILPNNYEIEEYYYKSELLILRENDKYAIFNPTSKKVLFEIDSKIEILNDNSNLEEFYFITTNKDGISKVLNLKGTEIVSGDFSSIYYKQYEDDRFFKVVNKNGLENEFSINHMKYKHPFFYKERNKKNDLTIYKIDKNYIVFKPNDIPFIKEEDGINEFGEFAGYMLFKKTDLESRQTLEGKLYNRRNKDVAKRDIPVYENVENFWLVRDTAIYTEIVFIDKERIVTDENWNIIFQKGEIPAGGALYYDNAKKAFKLKVYGVKEDQYFPIK